ncbi:FxLYD domain-containing protein [Paraburkholderia caribensis]|uniref:FxLYD domain-containing protein n=1 Tax=Paraburkholderia caribensis TaxID=75105 RepID=UPI0034D3092E
MQILKFAAAATLAACCASVVHAQAQQAQIIRDLPISEATLVRGNADSGRVTGVLTNNSGRALQSVVIHFAILDDQGVQIATATAAAMGVKQDGQWRFVAPYGAAQGVVATAKIGDIMAVPQP